MIQPPNNWLFQLANAFLFLSYLASDVLILRLCLAAAGICFTVWGGVVLAVSLDTVIWNGIFVFVNSYKVVRILHSRRPIQFTHPIHEQIYASLFKPVGVKRIDFKALMDVSLIRNLKKGSTYIEEGNEAHNLSLLYSGHMGVYKTIQGGKAVLRPTEAEEEGDTEDSNLQYLNEVRPMEFIESPEWLTTLNHIPKREARADQPSKFGSLLHYLGLKKLPRNVVQPAAADNTHDTLAREMETRKMEDHPAEVAADSNHAGSGSSLSSSSPFVIIAVSVRATEDSVFITWPMEILLKIVNDAPQLHAPLNMIIGSDVSSKLFRQTGRQQIRELQIQAELNLSHRDLLHSPLFDWQSLYKHFCHQLGEGLQMSKKLMTTLLSRARVRKIYHDNTYILKEGEECTAVSILINGDVRMITNGKETDIESYDFIGSIDYQSYGTKTEQLVNTPSISARMAAFASPSPSPSPFSASTRSLLSPASSLSYPICSSSFLSFSPCSLLSWQIEDLYLLLLENKTLASLFNALLAKDITKKWKQRG